MKEAACINCRFWRQENRRKGRCIKHRSSYSDYADCFEICSSSYKRCSKKTEKKRFFFAEEADDD